MFYCHLFQDARRQTEENTGEEIATNRSPAEIRREIKALEQTVSREQQRWASHMQCCWIVANLHSLIGCTYMQLHRHRGVQRSNRQFCTKPLFYCSSFHWSKHGNGNSLLKHCSELWIELSFGASCNTFCNACITFTYRKHCAPWLNCLLLPFSYVYI